MISAHSSSVLPGTQAKNCGVITDSLSHILPRTTGESCCLSRSGSIPPLLTTSSHSIQVLACHSPPLWFPAKSLTGLQSLLSPVGRGSSPHGSLFHLASPCNDCCDLPSPHLCSPWSPLHLPGPRLLLSTQGLVSPAWARGARSLNPRDSASPSL